MVGRGWQNFLRGKASTKVWKLSLCIWSYSYVCECVRACMRVCVCVYVWWGIVMGTAFSLSSVNFSVWVPHSCFPIAEMGPLMGGTLLLGGLGVGH